MCEEKDVFLLLCEICANTYNVIIFHCIELRRMVRLSVFHQLIEYFCTCFMQLFRSRHFLLFSILVFSSFISCTRQALRQKTATRKCLYIVLRGGLTVFKNLIRFALSFSFALSNIHPTLVHSLIYSFSFVHFLHHCWLRCKQFPPNNHKSHDK